MKNKVHYSVNIVNKKVVISIASFDDLSDPVDNKPEYGIRYMFKFRELTDNWFEVGGFIWRGDILFAYEWLNENNLSFTGSGFIHFHPIYNIIRLGEQYHITEEGKVIMYSEADMDDPKQMEAVITMVNRRHMLLDKFTKDK